MKNVLIEGPVTGEMVGSLVSTLGADTGAGAHSLFLGQVRSDMIDGRRVKEIIYSAYPEMVEAECSSIRDKIMTDYPDVRSVTIIHSTGNVGVGENSLLIIVTAGHRDEATRACRDALEMIKEKLPVWKKEVFDDDTYHWRENE